jgi:hypothetical protein
MIHGNVPLLCLLRPFWPIAGLMANWYEANRTGLLLRGTPGSCMLDGK